MDSFILWQMVLLAYNESVVGYATTQREGIVWPHSKHLFIRPLLMLEGE